MTDFVHGHRMGGVSQPTLSFDERMFLFNGVSAERWFMRPPPSVIAQAVLGCLTDPHHNRLAFNGDIRESYFYRLDTSVRSVLLGSRAVMWLLNRGYIDDHGEITEAGREAVKNGFGKPR